MTVETDRRICEELTERQGPNFSIGFRTLPDEKRWAIQASYAFCRIADDLADESDSSSGLSEQQEALRAWHEELGRVYDGRPTHPVGRALAASCQKFPIPRESFVDLIQGCVEDVEGSSLQSQRDLERYCDLVATSMGRICLSVFGTQDPRATIWARSLSHALQVTNILRDIREDHERGRVYLPQHWFDDAGLAVEDLISPAPRLSWYEIMNRGIAFARVRYVQALPLIGAVEPDSRLAVALMRGVYLEILEQIDRDPCRVLRERVGLDSARQQEVWRRAQALARGAFSGEA